MFPDARLMLGHSLFNVPDHEDQRTTVAKARTAVDTVDGLIAKAAPIQAPSSSKLPSTKIEPRGSVPELSIGEGSRMARRTPSNTSRTKSTGAAEQDALLPHKRPGSGSTDASISTSNTYNTRRGTLSTLDSPNSGAPSTNGTVRTSTSSARGLGILISGAKSGIAAGRRSRTDSVVAHDFTVDEIEGHSNIERILVNKPIITLDEIIDPEAIPDNSHVRSPSGNLLSKDEWKAHPNRPRTISERQRAIEEARMRMYAEKTKALLREQKPGKFEKHEKKPGRARVASPLTGGETSKKGVRKQRHFWLCYGSAD